MSYYPKGHQDGDDVNDFDNIPYGGGHDIALTYSHPFSPLENTCFPTTSTFTSSSFDYDCPQYSSYSQPFAYTDEALDNEYKSYARPAPSAEKDTG
ncbi:Uncharacterized protein LOK49_LG01G03460 [Camellia lanceoleosa]|uniref:Uncharacterized protein n=1 Tax=Camellia lanceoleosa TaxID=1840588 RepID=A0ACC0J4P9_9ERIC|nr:Uncharacterized protein LOK49_LG01G03460 [Camellia lanceoleosa]